ncbi:MAG: hypothetical protein AB8B69_02490 [Chitinophagales bacterium]
MNRILFFITIPILCLIIGCQNTPQQKDEIKSTDKVQNTEESAENIEDSSIESGIQFIRDKYEIISQADYKTVPFDTQCDERTAVKLDRKYNEKGELSYLLYSDCGEHGCSTKHHYYWEGELIFIFHKNDYSPGSSHIIEEHRTYFKNGKMIRCLEKKAHYHEGQAPMKELLKKASNQEVDCTPDKLTAKLTELETLSIQEAKNYFCSPSGENL